jgi:hypothetical protein
MGNYCIRNRVEYRAVAAERTQGAVTVLPGRGNGRGAHLRFFGDDSVSWFWVEGSRSYKVIN